MSKLDTKNTKNPQTIEDFLYFAELELKKFPNPRLEAEMLMTFALKKERVWLKINSTEKLSPENCIKFREILEKRRQNTPLAYIKGYKLWHNLKIIVSPDVLIPRDETEILANYILENSRDFDVKNILDIGTGSGCLAVFCAKSFPDAKVTALDIAKEALKIAQQNAIAHKAKIEFIESDLLDKISRKNYDIIIANLPYVPESIEITEDVKKEPHNAIFSGDDGLDLIRELAKQIESKEIKFKELWLEFWTAQEPEISQIFAGFSVEFYPDLAGDTYFAKITNK